MTKFINVASQKGGVGKSTIAFLLAREFTLSKWDTLIADMDLKQTSCIKMNGWRMQNGYLPELAVQQFSDVKKVQKVSSTYDLVIFDNPPHSTKITLDAAKISELTILPTQLGRVDLDEQILLAHRLVKNDIPVNRLAFVLSKVGDSSSEINAAREYIMEAGYQVLEGELPDKTAYRTSALDHGKVLTECSYKTLVKKADIVAESMIKKFEKVTK